ncbi:hypothetical protein GRZ55_01320 [Chelativorans sp. ZYF759]|uniref:hypothetical protein n=1 Tax=Chelativorans sp. ZYF759 TaxID=2692213 RepID=UPI00145C421A|nr:hypothetical protein [Chelativorans sp. ZYF759]NMG37875.1 hypothetical protein [Chelativorans sp. ZYF759]
MNTVTRNSEPSEGTAFEIPQLDAGTQPDCAPASAVRAGESETEAARVAIAREAASTPRASLAARWSGLAGIASTAARRRLIVSTIRDILDTTEARAARAEERARQAEELLVLHERHCICHAGKVAEAIAAEPVEANASAASGHCGQVSATDAKAEADLGGAARPSALAA